MSDRSNPWPRWAPYFQSLLRVVAGFLFMAHGGQKLFQWPAPMPNNFHPAAFTQLWFGGMLETFGGALILVGLYTRPVAFLVSGEMAVAYFQSHAPRGFWPLVNMGELAVLYCFVWLYLSAAGGGPWSLDALLRKRA